VGVERLRLRRATASREQWFDSTSTARVVLLFAPEKLLHFSEIPLGKRAQHGNIPYNFSKLQDEGE